MSVVTYTESLVEERALETFQALGYEVCNGQEIAPESVTAERADYKQVVLRGRLERAVARLNPDIPADAREEAIKKVLRDEHPTLLQNNERFHAHLVKGVDVPIRREDGSTGYDKVWLVDYEHPENNDWLAVNQFTIIGSQKRRPDVVVFVNGLPLGVIELKNPADENAPVKAAFQQLQTYKADIPQLFVFNELLVASDGIEAVAGSLTANFERFLPWRTVDGVTIASRLQAELDVLIPGVFAKERFLDLIRGFVVFDNRDAEPVKKIAGYHQYWAVKKAVDETVRAASPQGDRRIGVVWHTQGSGKSLSMIFYAGLIARQQEMENPTLVVITDRNDLDDQLFGEFAASESLLGQAPVQAEDRKHLRELLQVASGGIVFTTMQKFSPEKGETYPKLSERRNIVVIADEAHRTQYDLIDGLARNLRDALPNAAFIGFTGTPIETSDKSTRAIFGDYIDTYDIPQAVEDGATVPIYYEGRLAKLSLDQDERPKLDEEFEELTEDEEAKEREGLKRKWARLEALVGSPKRIQLIAEDLVEHFERREEAMAGKAMIVCMSRRICVALYDAIVALRPEWHEPDDADGAIKVVMTGSATDDAALQPHVRNKARREALAKRFKDSSDPLKLVIVRDMWLTGFDVPCLHTMYVDKPMRGHGLMQAIARVNRVFRDKPGGLIVDYLGLADQLQRALAAYTQGARGKTAIDQNEAVAIMLEKYEVIDNLFFGFNYKQYLANGPKGWIDGVLPAMEHILGLEDGKNRYLQAVTELSKAFALAVPLDEAMAIRDEVGFFQLVRGRLAKITVGGTREEAELDSAIQQLVSRSVLADEVVDIFGKAGLSRPDISVLSDSFLEEVRELPQKNVALETLRKLLNDEIKIRQRRNVTEAKKFSEMLELAMRKYQNRAIETAEIIEELIELAKDLRERSRRGEELGLNDDELAFYDAVATNESAVRDLGDDTLKTIARELARSVRANVSVDWNLKESARAHMRRTVKRLLRQYKYPPDQTEAAVDVVLEQATLFGDELAA